MTAGWLARAAGVRLRRSWLPWRRREWVITREDLAELAAEADRFLRAGGVVAGEEWAALTSVERLVLEDAGERIEAERAAARGFAAQGRAEAAEVLAPADRGRARERVLLEGLLAAAGADLPPREEAIA